MLAHPRLLLTHLALVVCDLLLGAIGPEAINLKLLLEQALLRFA
jgi:hypothetical protein